MLVAAQGALGQVAVRQVRHRIKRQAICGAADFMDADDVRMLQPGDGVGFVFETTTAYFIGQCFRQHDLQRDLAPKRYLVGQVHGGHPAMADDLDDAVALNLWLIVIESALGHEYPTTCAARSIVRSLARWNDRRRGLCFAYRDYGCTSPFAVRISDLDAQPVRDFHAYWYGNQASSSDDILRR